MSSYEEEEGDLLWNTIEQRKRTQNAGATPGSMPSSADPADQNELLAVIQTLQDVLQEETASEAGRIEARARLVEAIRGPHKPAESSVKPPRRWLVWPGKSERRQLVLAIMLLLLALIAIGYSLLTAYQRSCEAEQKQSNRPVSRLWQPSLQDSLSRVTAESLPMTDLTSPIARLSDSSSLTAKRCH